MAKQTIGIGTSANDGTGDSVRAGGDKVNDNFTEVYNALGNGTTIAANTGTLVSNAYAVATYAANTALTAKFNTFALVANVAALAALANTNSAIAKRAEVANVVTLAALANTNSSIATKAAVANVAGLAALGNTNSGVALLNTNLVATNTAIRLLVSDRSQVANVFSIFSSGKSYSTVPNYGAAVTYDISANGSNAYIVSNMGFGKGGAAFNNPELTVRNETTIAFDLNGLGGSHPFAIRSGDSGSSVFSNTLIHVATSGTITTGASAQGKAEGVLYWQIPHDIVSSGRNSYTYYCQSHAAMKGNVNIKDTGAI
tara:strand:- start:3525 stop:4466 length:942 start_codon:yes stop_codon:yes gene_type:complete